MNKDQAAHEIAMISAKTYCDSNMPEYIHNSGTEGLATDMAKKYIVAYAAAKNVLDKADA